MKIIAIDNFARQTVSDIVVATNVNEYYANLIVKLLNDHEGDNSPWYYKAVPDDYRLYVFEP